MNPWPQDPFHSKVYNNTGPIYKVEYLLNLPKILHKSSLGVGRGLRYPVTTTSLNLSRSLPAGTCDREMVFFFTTVFLILQCILVTKEKSNSCKYIFKNILVGKELHRSMLYHHYEVMSLFFHCSHT